MTRIIIYTFRTNKHLKELKNLDAEVFVFGKLKEDLIKFETLIKKYKPASIIGIAEVKSLSRSETVAVNSFGTKGKVSREGKDFYKLDVLKVSEFPESKMPTTSFCNWTMYKIGELINGKIIKNSFIHFNQADFPRLLNFLKNLPTHNPRNRY